jgi:very-short-patch-repair endonuclease
LRDDLLESVGYSVSREHEVRDAYEAWISETWQRWALEAGPAIRGRQLYEDLYEQRLRLEREEAEIELVWGHGVLVWAAGDVDVVRYPILTTSCVVNFDADSGAISVVPEGITQLNIDPLQGLIRVFDLLVDERTSFRVAPLDPWDYDATRPLYQRVVNSVDPDGRFVDGESLPPPETAPLIVETSLLFIRRRATMFAKFFEEMRHAIADGDRLPPPIAALVADSPSELPALLDTDGEEADQWTLTSKRLLMPLPTNSEQQRIAFQLAANTGVTVQGPPGTGKTHTIANLLSHLIAHGKRVLVTAYKEQPLRVLRDMVPDELRDLCVAVLGSSSSTLSQLDQSLQAISERAATLDTGRARKQIAELEQRVDETAREVGALVSTQTELKRNETKKYTLDGEERTASELGRWIASEERRLGSIPDQVPSAAACPIGIEEFDRLLLLEATLEPDDRVGASLALPDSALLPTAAGLTELMSELDLVRERLHPAQDAIHGWDAVDAMSVEKRRLLADDIRAATAQLEKLEEPWIQEITRADGVAADSWLRLLEQLRADLTEIEQKRDLIAAHHVTLPGEDLPSRELLDQLERLRDRFASGKRLGLLTPRELKRVGEDVLLDGEPGRTAEDFERLIAYVVLKRRRFEMRNRWNEASLTVSAPALDDQERPERVVGGYVRLIEEALGWKTVGWPELSRRLSVAGITPPEVVTSAQLSSFGDLAQLMLLRHEQRALEERLEALREELRVGARRSDASPLWASLREALDGRDLRTWARILSESSRLQGLRSQVQELEELSGRLAVVAPIWTQEIRSRRGEISLAPQLLPEAWKWRQAEMWLEDLITQGDGVHLARKLEEARDRLRRLTVELASESAWLAVAENLSDDKRRALTAWAQALRRVGKGTGKYAGKWRAEANDAMRAASDAIPVWVMPMWRVVESFSADHAPFDVVIVDESSQCDVFSFGALALARKAVIVGDDKQISPQAVGINLDEVGRLVREFLDDIQFSKLFDSKGSLYDAAKQRFPGVIVLREHFRCLPEIIQFSNDLAYDGTILPLREDLADPDWRPVIDRYIQDGYREEPARINPPEAEAIVRTITKLVEDPLYDGKTMGVISLLGSEQARIIEEQLILRLGEQEMERRELRCGDAYHFQGDERDVMFLSLVTARVDLAGNSVRQGAFSKESDVQRINVAASRGRDQVWLIRSVDAEDLPVDDVRGRLIRYYSDPGRVVRAYGDLADRCESEFEKDVLRRLLAREYAVEVQHRVGRYRIDFVIQGLRSRLAVECDGDAWHGPEHWEEDRARQEILERLGWKFFRIRGSEFYRNPDAALEPLWERLDSLAITPRADRSDRRPTEEDSDGRIEDTTIRIEGVNPDLEILMPSVSRRGASVDEPLPVDGGSTTAPEDNERESRAGRASSPEDEDRWKSSRTDSNESDLTLMQGIAMEINETLPFQRKAEGEDESETYPLDPNGYRGAAFSEVAIGVIPLQIALLVAEKGRLPAEALSTLYEQRFGVRVLGPDEKWLNRFAWSAAGLKFVRWDDTETVLFPGQHKAEVLDPPGTWTFAHIRALACERHKDGIRDTELFEQTLHAVYPGKRAPRLITRIVGSAVYAAEHDPGCK